MGKRIYKEYHLDCDKCGLSLFDKSLRLTYSPKERTKLAKENGWVLGEKDYCNDCKKELGKKK